MRASLTIWRGLGVFVLGFASALLTVLWFSIPASSRLTSNLPPDWRLASERFDARVRARFPVGTSLQVLAEELEREGFRPAWSDDQGGYNEYIAERRTGNLACEYSARVRWRLDDSGRLSSIRGLRREHCL